jgi:dTDP-glucose 4,6-dehydratase
MSPSMKLLVTGGCGFIGSHFIRLLLQRKKKVKILNIDAMTYAGRGNNLRDIKNDRRYRMLKRDIAHPSITSIIQKFKPDAVVNFAAESHVDRSLHSAEPFLRTNIFGTQNLLDACRTAGVGRFVQVSTDEVYGSVAKGRAKEDWPLKTSSPYSASKASADLLCLAAHHTHKQNVVITRCTNNYGPYQFPEKLIPLMITNAMHDIPLPVYGDGQQKRDWIHVLDHCRGVLLALEKGQAGEIYNFGMGSEPPNLLIVKEILRILKKPKTLIRHVKDRPGHDRRYAVDVSKSQKKLGWKPRVNFRQGLEETVAWYLQNVDWWLKLKDQKFQKFYKQHYGKV